MNLQDLINSSVIEFPLDQSESTYLKTIEKRFDNYVSSIKKLNNGSFSNIIKRNIASIEKLCDLLKSSVVAYLNGNSYDSYVIFTNAISAIENHFKILYSEPIDGYPLFRIRVSNTRINHGDTFHIPFESRHLVSSQRYSISGVPCLYFGSSAYISWKEMRSPNYDEAHMARFKFDKKLRVLNFGYDHRWIRNCFLNPIKAGVPPFISVEKMGSITENEMTRLFEAWFVVLPLLISVSVRKKHKDSKFTEAYIIPQNVMQLIKNDANHKIDGVRYVSTQFENEMDVLYGSLCWAFPVKENNENGHCNELKQMFSLTDPVQMDECLMKSIQRHSNVYNGSFDDKKGNSANYHETIWGKCESFLYNEVTKNMA